MTDAELNLLRSHFEKTFSCTFGFKRSHLGTYVNPSTSTRWRAFLQGAEAVINGKHEVRGTNSAPQRANRDC